MPCEDPLDGGSARPTRTCRTRSDDGVDGWYSLGYTRLLPGPVEVPFSGNETEQAESDMYSRKLRCGILPSRNEIELAAAGGGLQRRGNVEWCQTDPDPREHHGNFSSTTSESTITAKALDPTKGDEYT